MNSLGVFLISSLGASYVAIQQAERAGLELLETAPLGGPVQIIVKGEATKVLEFQKELRSADLLRAVTIDGYSSRMVETYFHLQSEPLKDNVFVLEGSFIGDLFQLCESALAVGLAPVEFRFAKFKDAKPALVLTGNSSLQVQKWWELALRKFPESHWIKGPGKTLRGLFESGPL